jgi:soluble lytic murein transglycosylase-like protein
MSLYGICLLGAAARAPLNSKMSRACQLASCVGILLAAYASAAQADVFAYTDERGVTHFSNVPVDGRYQLLIASPPEERSSSKPSKPHDWLAESVAYDAFIEMAALKHTVHPALIRAVIAAESGFNPRAVSKRGAIGLMQLLPETARRYGVSDIYDPAENIRAGTHYLSDLMVRFDQHMDLVLAAYNAGENAVDHYGGHIPPYKETQAYVPQVLRIYRALKAQQRAAAQS